jgi:hypothetical protein
MRGPDVFALGGILHFLLTGTAPDASVMRGPRPAYKQFAARHGQARQRHAIPTSRRWLPTSIVFWRRSP